MQKKPTGAAQKFQQQSRPTHFRWPEPTPEIRPKSTLPVGASAPTSGDEDTRFCCETITTINKGAASTRCATGKKHFIPPHPTFGFPWEGHRQE